MTRRKISIALLAGAVLFAFVALMRPNAESRYHGRSLSEWLAIYRTPNSTPQAQEEAANAIHHLGTNSLPLLLKWKTAPDPQVKAKLQSFLMRHRTARVPRFFRAWVNIPPDRTRAYQARMGFLILGKEAAPAIPQLARLAGVTNRTENALWAVETLENIGPQAMPALLKIAENPKGAMRGDAVRALGKFGTNALPAFPTIVKLLDDPQASVQSSAAKALGDLCLCTNISITALAKCLHSPDWDVRWDAAISLEKFGAGAQPAVSEFEKAISVETDGILKDYLSSMLRWMGATNTPGEPPAQ
jgi:HEAT repeat protein